MRRLRRIQERKRKAAGRKLRRRAVAAGAAAAITLAAGASLQSAHAAADLHQLILPADADTDLLADREELAIGYMPFNPDQNRNDIRDGAELANRCAAAIAELPEFYFTPPAGTDYPHKIRYLTDGTESCDICGFTICMDHWDIVNPRLGLTVPLPVMAAHYMEHGSFSYAASYHNGRARVQALLRVLEVRFPCDPNEHRLPLDANDLDGDLLADGEELDAGFDLYDADQDDDITPDGIELAEQCAAAIDALPQYDPGAAGSEPNKVYKINHWMRGLERCAICGENVNMGYWQVVNPKLDLSFDAYEIMLHYMTHGSFSHHGLQIDANEPFHTGRIDIPLLLKILEMPRQCRQLGTVYLPADFNRDCTEDFKDFADFAQKWLNNTDPNRTPDPTIIYQVGACNEPIGIPEIDNDFSLSVDGSYLRFEDDVLANCCPGRITIDMAARENAVTIFEKEYLDSVPCPCYCEFPASAILGPFEPGAYEIEVYLLSAIRDGQPGATHYLGTVNLTIGSDP